MRIKYTDIPIESRNKKNYICEINAFIRKASPEFDAKYKDCDAPLETVLYVMMALLGYISTELITALYPMANLQSLITKLNELVEARIVKKVSVSNTKKYGDSLVNNLYCLTARGVKQFEYEFPTTKINKVNGHKRAALHSYFTSFALHAGYDAGCICETEYEDPLYCEKNEYGIKVKRRLLRSDAVIIGDKKVCFIETETGYEKLQILLDKNHEYACHHGNFLYSYSGKYNGYALCYSVRKPHVTLAEEPRYNISMLRVLKEFLCSDYVKKRYSNFIELIKVRYENTNLTANKCKICRDVVKDIINNSPIDIATFRIDEFEGYYEDIKCHRSEVYAEDMARVHDNLCWNRMNHLAEAYLNALKSGDTNKIELQWMLGGQEVFFISTSRFASFLPFIFPIELKCVNKECMISDLMMAHAKKSLSKKRDAVTYEKGHCFRDKDILPRTPGGYICLNNAVTVEIEDEGTYIVAYENIAHDLSAWLRVYFASKYLTPHHKCVVVFCIVTDTGSIDAYRKMLELEGPGRSLLYFLFVSEKELLRVAD